MLSRARAGQPRAALQQHDARRPDALHQRIEIRSLDRRERDRIAVLDRPLVGHAHLALVDERDVGAGKAVGFGGDLASTRVDITAYRTWINNFELEEPIFKQAGLSTAGHAKIDEIPYDFLRKRLTIVMAEGGDAERHLVFVPTGSASPASCE